MSELLPPINESLFLSDIAKLVTTPSWIQWFNTVGKFVAPILGSADQKLFIQADGKGTEFSKGFYLKTFSRDMTAATATGVAHNGAGFKPGAVILIGGIPGTSTLSLAFSNFTTIYSLSSAATVWWNGGTGLVAFIDGSNKQELSTLVATSDGFTATWTKTGSPTGTFGYAVLFLR